MAVQLFVFLRLGTCHRLLIIQCTKICKTCQNWFLLVVLDLAYNKKSSFFIGKAILKILILCAHRLGYQLQVIFQKFIIYVQKHKKYLYCALQVNFQKFIIYVKKTLKKYILCTHRLGYQPHVNFQNFISLYAKKTLKNTYTSILCTHRLGDYPQLHR